MDNPDNSNEQLALFRFEAENFRVLRKFHWQPDGVVLLCGANGVGKSSALAAMRFLRDFLKRGLQDAVRFAGGPRSLPNRAIGAKEPVTFSLQLNPVRWELTISADGEGVNSLIGEKLMRGEEVVAERKLFDPTWTVRGELRQNAPNSSLLEAVWLADQPGWLRRFRDFTLSMRIYGRFDNEAISNPRPGDDGDDFLSLDGRNLTYVLESWKKAQRKHGNRFDWVVKACRAAFPELFEDLEFDRNSADFYPPDSRNADDRLPLRLAADGLKAALLCLTAVAGTSEGGVVAIDEFESHLHPYAIRQILKSIRELAETRNLTVVLTTHSPFAMNEFRSEPEQFYVIEPGPKPTPLPLSALHDADWLEQFSLGDLYDRGDIAAQAGKKR